MRRAGHIRERSPGSYELRYSLGTDPATGKRKMATATVRGSRKDADKGTEAAAAIPRHRRARGPDTDHGSGVAAVLAGSVAGSGVAQDPRALLTDCRAFVVAGSRQSA